MAIENIATGYNPQFALGALYHGFNAGSQDNANQLANLAKEWELQKSQAEDPYKVLEAMLAGNRANAMNTPEMLNLYTGGYGGQMESQIAAGKTAKALQPFKQAAEIAEAQQTATRAPLFTSMYKGIGDQHDQSLPPEQREAAGQKGFFMADTLSRVDPKVMAQERMLGQKLDSNEEMLDKRLAAAQQLAGMRTKAVAGDKTAEQAIVSHWRNEVAEGRMTREQFVSEMAELQNAKIAAKVQPGQMLDPSVAPGMFQAKPPQTQYTPNVGTAPAKADPLGIR